MLAEPLIKMLASLISRIAICAHLCLDSGHAGIHGNEVADYAAKSGSKSKIQYMVLNLLLQPRMPAMLARLRTVPQVDENLCGINGRTAVR